MDDTDFRSVSIEVEREQAAANDILTLKHDDGLCICCGFGPCYWRAVAFDRGLPLSATDAALDEVDVNNDWGRGADGEVLHVVR